MFEIGAGHNLLWLAQKIIIYYTFMVQKLEFVKDSPVSENDQFPFKLQKRFSVIICKTIHSWWDFKLKIRDWHKFVWNGKVLCF